ncbi:zinc finger A20 and AN1 domain-containing stress-associated protein 4-like [Salvia miltiorrhiza]|uniref:zinc finger A20 and AN1 domain-containing stress-associated protein 4-like n=1 Tax=Salvia miltiorrhiza TaxID=226208 RepID=UPI0025AC3884|nr:zinc finger A20 and AN1 domain-containing stress-associated protein 4-like [Salvia miltiorrhiza]
MDSSAACSTNQHHETPSGSGFPGTTEYKGVCSHCCIRHPQEKDIHSALISATASSPPPRSRCSVCRRRLGLLGFACRCGAAFCAAHRHPEAHGCTFDFKEAGKIAIAKQNPLIKSHKMPHRI